MAASVETGPGRCQPRTGEGNGAGKQKTRSRNKHIMLRAVCRCPPAVAFFSFSFALENAQNGRFPLVGRGAGGGAS